MHNLSPAPLRPLRGELVKGLGLAIVRTIVRGNCEINRGEAALPEGTWERLHNNNNNNNNKSNKTIVRGNCEINRGEAALLEGN